MDRIDAISEISRHHKSKISKQLNEDQKPTPDKGGD